MEKLQQALEKARSSRSGEADMAPRPAPRGYGGKSVAAKSGAWAALKQVTLDPDVLVRNRIVTFDAGPGATHFDILRTKILLQMRKNGWRRLAITSPTAACGKTTMACNLALGLSRQHDLSAMLLELDLRRPAMADTLGYRPEHDITGMLTGHTPFEDQAVRVRDNVAISMARRPSNDPTRYMLDREALETLDGLEQVYQPDVMIFDLPPLLLSDDTRAFLGNVDCALMVARAERSSLSQIDTCEREIAEHTNMLGLVLNQCRFADEIGTYEYDAYS